MHVVRSAASCSAAGVYLDREISLGRVIGPVDKDEGPVHTSRFGVIPKATKLVNSI